MSGNTVVAGIQHSDGTITWLINKVPGSYLWRRWLQTSALVWHTKTTILKIQCFWGLLFRSWPPWKQHVSLEPCKLWSSATAGNIIQVWEIEPKWQLALQPHGLPQSLWDKHSTTCCWTVEGPSGTCLHVLLLLALSPGTIQAGLAICTSISGKKTALLWLLNEMYMTVLCQGQTYYLYF